MKEAGFHVPDSFDLLPEMINKVGMGGLTCQMCFPLHFLLRFHAGLHQLGGSW